MLLDSSEDFLSTGEDPALGAVVELPNGKIFPGVVHLVPAPRVLFTSGNIPAVSIRVSERPESSFGGSLRRFSYLEERFSGYPEEGPGTHPESLNFAENGIQRQTIFNRRQKPIAPFPQGAIDSLLNVLVGFLLWSDNPFSWRRSSSISARVGRGAKGR
jgi:hypothetical protein